MTQSYAKPVRMLKVEAACMERNISGIVLHKRGESLGPVGWRKPVVRQSRCTSRILDCLGDLAMTEYGAQKNNDAVPFRSSCKSDRSADLNRD